MDAEENGGGALDSEGATTYVISSDCMNCGVCEFMCHTGAIVQAPNQFVIKKHLCDGCAECAPYCPAEAIVRRDRLAERQEDTVRARLRQVLERG